MLVHVELSCGGQGGENIPFEVVAVEEGECPVVEHEESGVDPVIRQSRFLDEAPDTPGLVPLEGPVWRRERYGGYGNRSPMRIVKGNEGLQVDRAETVAVGSEEGRAECRCASNNAAGRACLLTGVDHLDLRSGRHIFGEGLEEVDAVPAGENELAEPLLHENAHEVEKDRRIPHRHQRLRHLESVGVRPGSLAAAEYQGLHRGFISG